MKVLSACWCFSALACLPLYAKDLFNANAVTTDSLPQIAASDSGSDLSSLVGSVIKAQGPFSAFANRDYSSFLDYANVKHAIRFDVNSGGTEAQISIPLTHLKEIFFASNRNALYGEITAFVKRDGAAEWAKFLKAINQLSAVAVSDGNPTSTTALIANSMFDGFGSAASRAREINGKNNSFGISFDGGTFNADGFRGHSYTLPINGYFRATDRMTLHVEIPLQFIEVEGANIYQGGFTVGVPTKLVEASENQPWSWDVTPTAAFALSGSQAMVAGGGLFAGALTNVAAYRWQNITLTYGNFMSFFQGVRLTVGNYDFDSSVSQQIMKNGLRVSVPFADRWLFEAYGIHTKFFRSAAVNSYFTLGVDIGYRLKLKLYGNEVPLGYFTLGFHSDLAGNYDSALFRFGSAWTF